MVSKYHISSLCWLAFLLFSPVTQCDLNENLPSRQREALEAYYAVFELPENSTNSILRSRSNAAVGMNRGGCSAAESKTELEKAHDDAQESSRKVTDAWSAWDEFGLARGRMLGLIEHFRNTGNTEKLQLAESRLQVIDTQQLERRKKYEDLYKETSTDPKAIAYIDKLGEDGTATWAVLEQRQYTMNVLALHEGIASKAFSLRAAELAYERQMHYLTRNEDDRRPLFRDQTVLGGAVEIGAKDVRPNSEGMPIGTLVLSVPQGEFLTLLQLQYRTQRTRLGVKALRYWRRVSKAGEIDNFHLEDFFIYALFEQWGEKMIALNHAREIKRIGQQKYDALSTEAKEEIGFQIPPETRLYIWGHYGLRANDALGGGKTEVGWIRPCLNHCRKMMDEAKILWRYPIQGADTEWAPPFSGET